MQFAVLSFFRSQSVVTAGNFAGCFLAGCILGCEPSNETSELVDWGIPPNVDIPRAAADLRVVDIELGEHLFFSTLLSRDGSTSCSSCHRPEFAFSDGRARSIGIDGDLTPRNSPSLVNSAWSYSLTWSNLALRDLRDAPKTGVSFACRACAMLNGPRPTCTMEASNHWMR